MAGETLVISAPARCYRPAALQNGGRAWGPSLQLYSLRSHRNWGMGDFTDLRNFIGPMAQSGASLVGLNPLHAMFTSRPAHASPYSPSSKRLLNVLYIDPEAVDGFDDCAAAKARLKFRGISIAAGGLAGQAAGRP
jgi:(1->4)-alpha-D-glucan 1-alpha-D-glucosylmutase